MPLPIAAAAAPAAAGAGKGAATAGAGAAAGGAGKGGLGAFMGSTGGQALMSTILGVAASQNPQTAAGVRTGMGAYGMLQSMTDSRNVAEALTKYSGAVKGDVEKEVMDRQMNEAILSLGSDDPSGGAVRSTYEGQDIGPIKAHAAAVGALPALGAANPSQAGFMLADTARRAPSPTPRAKPQPDLYKLAEEFHSLSQMPGIDLTADMTAEGVMKYRFSEEVDKPITEEPILTPEQQADLIDRIENASPSVQHRAQFTGETGAEHTVTSRVLPKQGGAAGGGGGGADEWVIVTKGGVDFLQNKVTGEVRTATPEMLQEFAKIQAMKESGGIAGTVIRNRDGTTTIRR